MVTLNKYVNNSREACMEFNGLSTDTKPIRTFANRQILNSASFYEMDTKKFFFYDAENHIWLET